MHQISHNCKILKHIQPQKQQQKQSCSTLPSDFSAWIRLACMDCECVLAPPPQSHHETDW